MTKINLIRNDTDYFPYTSIYFVDVNINNNIHIPAGIII